jgi:hypothetical protein
MQPICCTLSKAHSHASPRFQPFQVVRPYDLSEASLQVFTKCFHRFSTSISSSSRMMQPANRRLHIQDEQTYSARAGALLCGLFVPKDETSSGQGTCLQCSDYPSHQGGLCCYGVRELSGFTDRCLVKQRRRPCDDIRLRGLWGNSVIGHF